MRSDSVRVSEEDFSFNPVEFLLLSCETVSRRQCFFLYTNDANPWHTLTLTHTQIYTLRLTQTHYSCYSWHTVSIVFALGVNSSHST